MEAQSVPVTSINTYKSTIFNDQKDHEINYHIYLFVSCFLSSCSLLYLLFHHISPLFIRFLHISLLPSLFSSIVLSIHFLFPRFFKTFFFSSAILLSLFLLFLHYIRPSYYNSPSLHFSPFRSRLLSKYSRTRL